MQTCSSKGRVLVESKAILKLAIENTVQLVNYLVATGINDGLLLGFGPPVQIKH